MPSTMPTSESRLLKEYMVDGEGLVPGFTLIQERELWEIIGTGVGIDFTVGLFVSGDNLVNHIQGKAVNSEEEDHPLSEHHSRSGCSELGVGSPCLETLAQCAFPPPRRLRQH
jgi:hypothetical protein